MTDRVEVAHDGSMKQTTLHDAGKVSSSNDFKSTGVKVSRGFGSHEVSSAADLQDNDILKISGMELTAKQARELGLLGRVFDQPVSLSAGAAQAREEAAQKDTQDDGDDDADVSEYEYINEGLTAAIEDGSMRAEEATEYSTAVGQIALAGMDVQTAIDAIEGMANGSVDASDLDQNTRASLEAAERSVGAAATKAAQAELGREGFQYLQQAARIHPGVNEAIRQFSVTRATGGAQGVTWQDFYAHVRAELEGGAV